MRFCRRRMARIKVALDYEGSICSFVRDNQTTNREEKQEEKQEKQVAVAAGLERRESSKEVVTKSEPSGKGIMWGVVAFLTIVFSLLWWFGGGKKGTH